MTEIRVDSPLDNVIATTEVTLSRLLKLEDKARGDAIALYMFYLHTGHWQARKSDNEATRYNPKANNAYAMKSLGWGRDKLRNARKILEKQGLVEVVQKSYGHGTDTYINVKYVPKGVKVQGAETQGAGFQGAGTQGAGKQHHIQVTNTDIQVTNTRYRVDAPAELKSTPSNVARDFFLQGEKYHELREKLLTVAPEQIVDLELQKFCDYWTEPNKSGSKVRWELERTFEVERRLRTWLTNTARWTKEKQKAKGKQIV